MPAWKSATHFFMNEFLAAPARALPFLSTALAVQPDAATASASHFLIDDDLAAPVSGLPSLLTALASQADGAGADAEAAGADAAGVEATATCENNTLAAKRLLRATEMNLDMETPLRNGSGEMPTIG